MGSIIFFNGLPARATLNQEMSRVYVIKDKMGGRSSQKALRVLSPLPWDRFLRRGDESFLVFWRTVETSTNLLRRVIGLIPTRNDYPNTVLDDVLSLRGSCTYTVPPPPPPTTRREKLQFVAAEGLDNKGANTYLSFYLFFLSFQAHHMAVYSVKWNHFHPKIFISCSADWTVKIWDHNYLYVFIHV